MMHRELDITLPPRLVTQNIWHKQKQLRSISTITMFPQALWKKQSGMAKRLALKLLTAAETNSAYLTPEVRPTERTGTLWTRSVGLP